MANPLDTSHCLKAPDGCEIVARRLLAHLRANGWIVVGIWDGDLMSRPADDDAAIRVVFDVPQVSIRVSRTADSDPDWGEGVHGVLIVLGNEPNGEDLVSDWNYHTGDADGFNAVMEAFTAAL